MIVKITSGISINGIYREPGKNLDVTNSLGRQLIEQKKAIQINTIPALTTKTKKTKKVKWN